MAKRLIIAWITASISVFGKANILIGPQDTEAIVEESVELYCKGTLGNVEWQHSTYGTSNTEHVYKDGFFFGDYKGRAIVNTTDDGRNTLIILHVKPRDAGKFTCLEVSETPSQKSAELIVFERFPSNESCAGRYTCKPICNELELSCNMKAHGNHIPSMQWIDRNGKSLESTNNIANETAISTVKLESHPHEAVLYTCRLQYQRIPLISKYNWIFSTSGWESLCTCVTPGQQPPPEPVSTATSILIISCICTAVVSAFLGVVASILIMKTKMRGRNQDTTTEESQLLLKKTTDVDEDAVKMKFTPCTIVNKGNPIHSIAAIDNEVFITTTYGCVVEVFDLCGGEFIRFWPVEGLVNPNDMAACTKNENKMIFICDWKKTAEDNEIFCLDKDGKLLCRWLPENHMGRISITKDCHVLVADGWYNTVKEYTSTGRLLKTLLTGQDKLHLWHAVKLHDGNFVAGFGDAKDDHREICILDEEGRVINSLKSDSNLALSVPRSLAADKEGNIYICDLYHGRIIVLNPELEFKRFIYTTSDRQELRGPLRICVHDFNNKGWLLVADSGKEDRKWTNGRVAVWNLQDLLRESVSET